MDQPPAVTPIDILLIEDDSAEIFLTREMFADFKLHNPLIVKRDGWAALAYLRQTCSDPCAARPGLILLDLNLPGLDGRELLARIAADPTLADIPVVVLTSSLAESDILRARQLHVTDYMIKPVDFIRLLHVVRQVEHLGLAVTRSGPAT